MFDPQVSISDPDNTLDYWIYEGLASLAHTMLVPGVYLAVAQPDAQLEVTFDVKVVVTESESHAIQPSIVP